MIMLQNVLSACASVRQHRGRWWEVATIQSVLLFLFRCVQDGLTPLVIAANKGHVQFAELLLSRGADVTHQTKVRLSLLGPKVMLL